MIVSLYNRIRILLLILFLSPVTMCWAQQDAMLTHSMTNPLNYNPAVAGSHNSLSIQMITRQQWIDVKDAPATYLLNVHTPVNATRASLGLSVISDQAGPVMNNKVSFAYSYLIRISRGSFLSLGISGGASQYQVNLQNIKTIDKTDPLFAENINNAIKPSFGSGLIFFTRTFYLGLSVPEMLQSSIPYENKSADFKTSPTTVMATSGYRISMGSDFSLKGSALARISSEQSTYDFALEAIYQRFQSGAAYRINHTASLMLGVRLGDNMTISYAYDFPINSQVLNIVSSQELSISFQTDYFYKYNKFRNFKKKRQQSDDPLRSIRYF
ncbi:PorP/SprF family type IX secretion system membrane protein [Geofilum sp. OHC36d9]|uniref:PorP/SprF family type IX secretion system membrane protein n=1 Tax=Geofilum sp. OHC36d9 TaxID=3458413 RepID=UPI004033D62D